MCCPCMGHCMLDAAPCAAAGITELFDSIQLIPASSGVDHSSAQKDKAHFPRIQQETGVPYSDMLFFDDESPNIAKVQHDGLEWTCHSQY